MVEPKGQLPLNINHCYSFFVAYVQCCQTFQLFSRFVGWLEKLERTCKEVLLD